MKKLKCKSCKEPHSPFNSLDNWCKKIDCQTKKALFLLEKKKVQDQKDWSKEKKQRKEALKTTADYVRELQVIFNKFIRLRDKEKGCISCGKSLNTKFDAGHYFSTGSYPELRFHEDNVHGQCVHCNQHKRGNLIEYLEGLQTRIGLCKILELKKLANIPKKYSVEQLKGLKVMYKLKIKQLQFPIENSSHEEDSDLNKLF